MKCLRIWIALLLLCSGLWAADKPHTLRTAQIKRYAVEWSDAVKGINGFNVDFFDAEDKYIGGVTFLFLSSFNQKARSAGLKELEGNSLSSAEKPFSVGGRSIFKLAKEFSVDLKPGGALRFWVKGKETFQEQEWDFDVKADLQLPLTR